MRAREKICCISLVIIPLWVSYLVRAYAWKTILGSEGVLNTLLQYVHLTRHPLDFSSLQSVCRGAHAHAILHTLRGTSHLRCAGAYTA